MSMMSVKTVEILGRLGEGRDPFFIGPEETCPSLTVAMLAFHMAAIKAMVYGEKPFSRIAAQAAR